MKKDALDRFVAGHRDQFDDKLPSENIWARISVALFGVKTDSLWNSVVVWRAAAGILLALSIYLLFNTQNQGVESKALAAQQDFADIEAFYAAQISEKVALISHEGLFADDNFTQDLQKLEAMYTVLSEAMKKHPSEKVKDALVLNMLVRIDLLNQQIQKLEESKKRDKEAASSI